MNWLGSVCDFLLLRGSSLAFLTLILCLVRSIKFHFMWVDDLSLLLEVESLLVILNFSLRKLSIVVLSVVAEKRFRVRVPNEPISASNCARALVTRWQILDYRKEKITVSYKQRKLWKVLTRYTYKESGSKWTE